MFAEVIRSAVNDTYRQVALNTKEGDRAIMLAVELLYWDDSLDVEDIDAKRLREVRRECNRLKAECGLSERELALMLATVLDYRKSITTGIQDHAPALRLVA
jgi:hypothetical protein